MQLEAVHRWFWTVTDCNGDWSSFPTRRSSDLALGVEAPGPDRGARRARMVARVRSPWFRSGGDRASSGGRSEEHTSELQSLRHLVCRLLLEKKNNRRFKPPILLQLIIGIPSGI